MTITDLAFMHATAMEGEKDKAAREEIKAKMVSLRRERDDLRDELEKERGDKLRLMNETDRGTLEQQVVEWTARAKTAEEKCKRGHWEGSRGRQSGKTRNKSKNGAPQTRKR